MKINSKLLIAEQDIISYKLGTYKSKLFTNNYIVDLYDTNVRLNSGNTLFSKIATNSYDDNSIIESGIISFKYTLLEKLSNNIIIQCTIPKGAKYYTGYHFNKLAYASDYLLINKVIQNIDIPYTKLKYYGL